MKQEKATKSQKERMSNFDRYELLPLSMAPNPYLVKINYIRPAFNQMKTITKSNDIEALMRKQIADESLDYKEKSWLVCLTRANRVLSISLLGIGTLHCTVVPTHEILQTALLTHASAVILLHNHPSGKLDFSGTDKEITKRIQKALELVGIQLLDHVILTTESYASMADEGLL